MIHYVFCESLLQLWHVGITVHYRLVQDYPFPLPTFLDLLQVIIHFPIGGCTVWIHWGFTTNMVFERPLSNSVLPGNDVKSKIAHFRCESSFSNPIGTIRNHQQWKTIMFVYVCLIKSQSIDPSSSL